MLVNGKRVIIVSVWVIGSWQLKASKVCCTSAEGHLACNSLSYGADYPLPRHTMLQDS